MHMLNQSDIFSDVFAQKDNLVTRVEARTKIVFIIFALVINLVSTDIYTPLGLVIFSLITLLLIRVPARLILLRLVMPLAMAMVVLIPPTSMSPSTT